MYLAVIIAVLGGFFLGAAGMYFQQRRQREQELKKITKLTEDILNGRELKAAASGEETLYAKIEHQLVRVQELMQGRRAAAERSREEIQKLISEIAHQMRAPLTNMVTYLGFLRENLEKDFVTDEVDVQVCDLNDDNRFSSAAMLLQYVAAIENSEQKLYFLVESFIKMSRLEHHIIQIKKEEIDIQKTVRNALGQILSRSEAKQVQFDITFPENAACMILTGLARQSTIYWTMR